MCRGCVFLDTSTIQCISVEPNPWLPLCTQKLPDSLVILIPPVYYDMHTARLHAGLKPGAFTGTSCAPLTGVSLLSAHLTCVTVLERKDGQNFVLLPLGNYIGLDISVHRAIPTWEWLTP